jgi:hypothetical protein
MFCPLDVELFPDLCEVAEMPLHGQWVYMIQKNGTSSIRDDPKNHYRIYVNKEISQLDFIDVYIRDSRSRYISGVHTFVKHTIDKNPNLDRDTVIWMATRYLFLNTHYLPQILWLVNLTRYLHSDTLVRFRDFCDYGNVVAINHKALIDPPDIDTTQKILCNNHGLDLWFFADQILLDLKGQAMTWSEIKNHYKTKHANVWEIITQTANQFSHVLS